MTKQTYPVTIYFRNFSYNVLNDVLKQSWYSDKIKDDDSEDFDKLSSIYLNTNQKQADFNEYRKSITNYIDSLFLDKDIGFSIRKRGEDLI